MDKSVIKLEFGSDNVALKERFKQLFERSLMELDSQNVIRPEEKGVVVLELIDDAEMQIINKKYRNIDKPTDVVSLSYRDEIAFPTDDNLLGEIFISTDTAGRQAPENGNSLDQEMDFLFVHGVLHVFGFDHQTKNERESMFKLQDQILR